MTTSQREPEQEAESRNGEADAVMNAVGRESVARGGGARITTNKPQALTDGLVKTWYCGDGVERHADFGTTKGRIRKGS